MWWLLRLRWLSVWLVLVPSAVVFGEPHSPGRGLPGRSRPVLEKTADRTPGFGLSSCFLGRVVNGKAPTPGIDRAPSIVNFEPPTPSPTLPDPVARKRRESPCNQACPAVVLPVSCTATVAIDDILYDRKVTANNSCEAVQKACEAGNGAYTVDEVEDVKLKCDSIKE